MNKVINNLIIFHAFGSTYVTIELLFRGHTHISMYLLGGLCGLLIGLINEIKPKMELVHQMLLGSIIVTILEYITGYIVNIKLGLNVWDYSNLPLNINGQISLAFSIAWFFLSYFAIKLDDYIKEKL